MRQPKKLLRREAAALERALERALARVQRREKPQGDRVGGVWLPSDEERQPCCDSILPPQPQAGKREYLRWHCRSLVHVAHLEGVDPEALGALWTQRGHSVRAHVRSPRRGSSQAPRVPYTNSILRTLEKEREGVLRRLRKQAGSLGELAARLAVAATPKEASEILAKMKEVEGRTAETLRDFATVYEICETAARASQTAEALDQHAEEESRPRHQTVPRRASSLSRPRK